jgi:chaperonin GroES
LAERQNQKELHPESRNLALDMEEDTLNSIGAELCEYINHDNSSRSEWVSEHAKWLKLYYQKDVPANPPWQGSSNESIPMLAEACNQFHARAYPAMFPNRNVIQAIPVGKSDAAARERAERIGTHMSWQLMVQDKGYKRNKDRLLLGLPLDGSFFTKAYYDPIRKRNVVENVRASDLIVPYGVGPRDIEDIDRKTQIIYLSMNKCHILKELGYFSDVPDEYDWDENDEIDESLDDAQGVSRAGYSQTNTARIYECHTVLDLDGDNIAEPYIVTIDSISQKVLRLSVRYDTDEAGNPTNDKAPVEYFTAYNYLENPNGFYGLGQGHLIAQPNAAVNKLLRQTIDAGTLANIGNMSGFISQQLGGIAGGELEMTLGKFTKIPGSVDDIARGIFQFKFPGPQPALMDIAALLMQRSDRLATVTEALTGQTDKVIQPTALMALVEQGLTMFSTVYERVLNSWQMELDKLYRLNHKYLDPEEYFSVLDVTGEITNHAVDREDYAPDFQVMPVADPKNVSKQQKLAKAEAEWMFLSQNPLLMQSPKHLYNASRRYLQAIESEGIDEVLPNPEKDILPRVDDPQAENAFLLSPEPMISLAYPDQDHMAHLESHMALLNDPVYGADLTDIAIAKLQEHISAHKMMLYGATESGLRPATGMDGATDDQGGLEGIIGAVSDALGGGGGLGGAEEIAGAVGGNPLPAGGPVAAGEPEEV